MRALHVFLFFLLGTLLFCSCGGSKKTLRGGNSQSGVASWYGPKFHGRQTANGERFNQNDLTAAHRTLAFGTKVKVTNLDNGRSVVVRINDRGPYAKNRIIDLSREAAKRVGMINSGTAKVRLQVLSAPPLGSSGAISGAERWGVQVASYETKSDAERRQRQISGAYILKAKVKRKMYYRVFVGKYDSKNDAERKRKDLRRKGIKGFVKQLQN